MSVIISQAEFLSLIYCGDKYKRVAATKGGEYAGACPFCGGKDRFRAWPQSGRWWCRQCERKGDAIDFLRQLHGWGYKEACEYLQLPAGERRQPQRAAPVSKIAEAEKKEDRTKWKAQAKVFSDYAHEKLNSDEGARARAWLEARGVNAGAAWWCKLGYNPRDIVFYGDKWGLPGQVRIPRGIVIPWFDPDGEIEALNIRRPKGEPRYMAVKGSRKQYYKVFSDIPLGGEPVILVEGEFDCIVLHDLAGDMVTAIALGSASGGRGDWLVTRLALCPVVLVAFDADDAGEAGAAWWCERLPNARRLRPYWGDVSDLARAGADVRGWLDLALGEAHNEPINKGI